MKALGWAISVPFIAAMVFALAVISALFEAVALVKLNEWFFSPIFHIPVFGYWQAAGIAITFAMLTHRNDAATEVEGTEALKRLSRPMLRPWFVLAFGYCFHLWAS